MNWRPYRILILLLSLFLLFTTSAYAQRDVNSRARIDWRDLVTQRQQAFQENPNAKAFARTLEAPFVPAQPVSSHNEAAPVQGFITEWWCSSNGNADLWDEMWMALIGESVKNGSKAYVYLFSYLGDNDETTLNVCADMLEKQEGIARGQVNWIQDFETDAFWLRDFGPFFVSNDNTSALSIEDSLYYPGRPHDDDQPKDFADRYSYPIRDLNLYYEGGNFLPNGGGICIASSVLTGVNPQYTESEIRQMMKTHLGCDDLVIVDALNDAATGHVDMWLAWANQTTLVVGQYSKKQDPVNSALIEKNISEKLANLVDPETHSPIAIVRMPMPSNCPPQPVYTGTGEMKIPPKVAPYCGRLAADKRIWRTYLNVTFVNDTVVVPVYAQDKTYEQQALDIWRGLGFLVRPVVADHIAPYQGEFHCITKTIPEVM